MPLTLTDEQVEQLRREREQWGRDKAVREFTESIWNDPALSDDAKALAKRKYPDAAIPDYDLRKEVIGRLDKEKAEREEAARKAQEEERTKFYTNQRAKVQKDYGFTDDAMTRIEAEMNERKVYDYEVMASHWAAKNPKPIQPTNANHFWHHDRSEEFQRISKDPEGFAFDEIVRAVQTDDMNRRNR